jgi:hypothetical protein
MIHGVTAVLRRDFLVIDSVLFRDLSDLCWRAGVAEIGLIEDPVEDCSGPIWLRGGISLDVSRRLSVRSPKSNYYLPMRRIAEQTVLRWQPRIAQIQGEDNR